MIEGGKEFGFTLETGNTVGVLSELFRQDLDRHISTELCVFGLIHLPHAAFANLGSDFVMGEFGSG